MNTGLYLLTFGVILMAVGGVFELMRLKVPKKSIDLAVAAGTAPRLHAPDNFPWNSWLKRNAIVLLIFGGLLALLGAYMSWEVFWRTIRLMTAI